MDKTTIEALIADLQAVSEAIEQGASTGKAELVETLGRSVGQLRALLGNALPDSAGTPTMKEPEQKESGKKEPGTNDAAMIDAGTWVSLRMAVTGCDRETAEAQLLARVEAGHAPDADMRFPRESVLPGSSDQPTHRHRKGGLYRMLARGYLEETLAPCVIYQDFREGYVWVRPEENFMDGRFTALVDEAALPQRIPLKPRKA